MKKVRSSATHPLTIVIKLGTSSIIHETTHQPLLSILSAIVETVVRLKSHGHKVVLVSSGAIGVGLKRMEMAARPKTLSGKQALAAIGQGRLIALWDNLFSQLGQPIAQVLLTRGDISDRTRYLNAVNTLAELLSMGVVPIVNENDTISVSEIKFGDNDTLSAITSSMLHADYLFLLTDVDSLYTSNPRKNPLAKAIETVTSISAIRSQVSTATLGSSLGTGGMETKLIAAEIATAAGVSTVITSSKNPSNIFNIIEYNTRVHTSPTLGSDSPTPPSSSTPAPPLFRPPHTLFTPSPTPLRDLKQWTSHTLHPSGSVIIDTGAHHVLSRRDSGGRLLPIGVVGVEGSFAGGQAVRIVVRRRKGLAAGVGSALAKSVISYANVENESPATIPSSPLLKPVTSTSTSISSIDPLSSAMGSRHVSISDAAHMAALSATPHASVDGAGVGMAVGYTIPEHDGTTAEKEAEWEDVEVGRGLTNYNSAEIDKVKGRKSSLIAELLGYADSEYVVENVTIRVPP